MLHLPRIKYPDEQRHLGILRWSQPTRTGDLLGAIRRTVMRWGLSRLFKAI